MRRSWRIALAVGVVVAVFAATSAGAAKFITGGDIKNGSIGLRDLSAAAKRALKGKSGAAGPAGPAGPQGPAGPASLSTTVRTQDFVAPPNGTATGEVRCPDGMVAVGGSASSRLLFVWFSELSADGRGWTAAADEFDGSSSSTMHVAVICTPGNVTVLPTGS